MTYEAGIEAAAKEYFAMLSTHPVPSVNPETFDELVANQTRQIVDAFLAEVDAYTIDGTKIAGMTDGWQLGDLVHHGVLVPLRKEGD